MKQSGFYKLEDGSYEYVCGGKIVFDGETDLNKSEAKLIISEAECFHEIGSVQEYKGDVSAKGLPHVYIIFSDKKSIQAMIESLEDLKLNLK